MSNNRGFTLIEVMIALSIFAVTAGAVVLANVSALSTARVLEEQTQARWVAQDYLTSLRLRAGLPDDGVHHEDIEYNDRKWVIDYRVTSVANETFKPYYKQIEFKTRLADQDDYADILIAYLGKI